MLEYYVGGFWVECLVIVDWVSEVDEGGEVELGEV